MNERTRTLVMALVIVGGSMLMLGAAVLAVSVSPEEVKKPSPTRMKDPVAMTANPRNEMTSTETANLEKWCRDYLDDPSFFEIVETKLQIDEGKGRYYKAWIRAKNRFGAKSVRVYEVFLNLDQTIRDVIKPPPL